jgi:hypothetical protein
MKNNNRLTLKALKQELDLLKVSKTSKIKPIAESHKANAVGHDIKQSYIQNLHMRSSMFMLWVITTILAYAHKIPFIGRIITLLSIWYGRTTIWKILVRIRKVFIAFNAIIGVYMVYKSVGFGPDNVLAGFVGMGHSYLEIFMNFTKRLFNWIFELFDYKVIPNVPGGSSTGSTNSSKFLLRSPIDKGAFNPFLNNDLTKSDFSLRELYKSPFNINLNTNTLPWYRDLSTWFWIAGIAGTLGFVYCGYKFITDPLFLHDWFSSKVTKSTNIPLTEITPPSDGSITPTINEGGIAKSIVTFITAGYSKLNPFNWFSAPYAPGADKSAAAAFYQRQSELNTFDNRFYPFTNVNPHSPWYTRLKILMFGESSVEMEERIKAQRFALRDYLAIQVTDARTSGSMSPILNITSGSNTPGWWSPSNVGIGVKQVSGSGLLEVIEASSSYNTLVDKISSVPSTPKIIPSSLLESSTNTVV